MVADEELFTLERNLTPPSWSGLDNLEQRVVKADDEVHRRLRRTVSVPVKRWLWTPKHTVEFTPALSDTMYGDGRALLAITTIHDRPHYWLVRIDSGWWMEGDYDAPGYEADDDPVGEYAEHIVENLLMEFGSGAPPCDGEEFIEDDPEIREYGPPYPCIDVRDGYSWGRVSWPEEGFDCVQHPYSVTCRILAGPEPEEEPGP